MTYWESKGKYQKEADLLDKKVPKAGKSNDTRIELYRCACNVYYDVFNNGGCNLDESDSDLTYLHSQKFDTPIIDEMIEEFELVEDGDPKQYFEKACEEIDQVIDKIIEHIRSTGFFNEKEVTN